MTSPTAESGPLKSSMKKTTRFSSKDVDPDQKELLINPSPNVPPRKVNQASPRGFLTEQTAMMSAIHESKWKPPTNISFETIVLTDSELNTKIRPAGFRPNARYR